MKQGRTIVELAKELERQRLARKDFITDTRGLTLKTDGHGNSTLCLDMGKTENDGLKRFGAFPNCRAAANPPEILPKNASRKPGASRLERQRLVPQGSGTAHGSRPGRNRAGVSLRPLPLTGQP